MSNIDSDIISVKSALGRALTQPEFLKVLMLSTAHITRVDSELLDRDAQLHRLGHTTRVMGLVSAAHEYGNWVHVPSDPGLYEAHRNIGGYSSSMIRCFELARELGAAYINFDRDGNGIYTGELDVHEW